MIKYIFLVITCLYAGVLLKSPETRQLKKENTTLQHANDSLTLLLAKRKAATDAHFAECAFISRNQIKSITNQLWIVLKDPLDTSDSDVLADIYFSH